MTADALQLLFAAPNAETLLYPLVKSCDKSGASNQQLSGTNKAQRVEWTRYWLTYLAVLLMPWCCAQALLPHAKIYKARADEPKSHMFAAVMNEPND
jgi:hypothetical protein